MQGHTHQSLAEVAPGQAIIIRRVLFEMLRELCTGLEVKEGDALECQAAGNARIFLRKADGRIVSCERDWARLVEGEPATDLRGADLNQLSSVPDSSAPPAAKP